MFVRNKDLQHRKSPISSVNEGILVVGLALTLMSADAEIMYSVSTNVSQKPWLVEGMICRNHSDMQLMICDH